MISRIVLLNSIKLPKVPPRFGFIRHAKFRKVAAFTTLTTTVYCYANHQQFKFDFEALKKILPLELFIAHCKENIKKSNRTKVLDKAAEDESKKDVISEKSEAKDDQEKFDWSEFWQLISSEKFYFISAICVSCQSSS